MVGPISKPGLRTMRLVTAIHAGREFTGAWVDADTLVLDLATAARVAGLDARPFADMQTLIASGPRTWDIARELVLRSAGDCLIPTRECALRAPLPCPAQLRDFLCFEQHLLNAFAAAKELICARSSDPDATRAELDQSGAYAIPAVWYQSPIYYNASRFAVCGHDTDVFWPAYSEVMDFELEFAAVIGKPGHDIRTEDALAHVFGYTVFNDFSARDEQFRAMAGKLGPGKGKDFDNANALGPCIVTADEIGDPYSLTMSARVNGEEWSRGNTSSMFHRFEQVIAHISRSETLHPGEVLGSGTVGTGCGLEQNRYLKSGDVVELEIERIGVLRNRVLRKT
jgi:2-keto-4-pentenoate hydratase/2-oxohepta-3-ene-1,7-dioic acid hydratase in catechol pathway